MRFSELQNELEALDRQHLRRSCRRVEAVEGGRILIDGRWRVNLAANDYLGLTRHPRVVAAAREALERFGAGSGSARLIAGTSPLHEALEEKIARFKQAEAALVFPTGYMANLGVVTALMGPEDLVLSDRFNHASLIDACRLSGAAFRVYPHADAGRLEEILRRRRSHYRRVLVITEGLFSMEGDIPPLPEIAEIVRRHEAWLLVDDAHATGVLGKTGRGSLEHFEIPPEGILQMGTLSKALGSLGGYVAGPKRVIELLMNKARSFIFTTAPASASMAAAREAIRVIQEEPVWRDRLWENTRRWIAGLQQRGVALHSAESPIVPIRVGSNDDAMALARALLEEGIYAPGIRPPTVPEGSARIRTSLSALHTSEDLETALQAWDRVLQENRR